MIAIGILSVFAVLACHWLGIYLNRRVFDATLAHLAPRGTWGAEAAFAIAIFGLVLLNFADVLICTLLLRAQDAAMPFDDAFEFAIANFTTIGTALKPGLSIPSMAGPLIAMCGIVIFGWSTSFLVACSNALRRLPSAQGRTGVDAGSDHERVRL